MLETIIPTLITVAFATVTFLLGNRFLTDPLQEIKTKQEAISGLPDGPRKTCLQSAMELHVTWAIKYGDAFITAGKTFFWSAAILALFIMAGSAIILSYVIASIDASIRIGQSLNSYHVNGMFQLILDLIQWTFKLMIAPLLIGALGFVLTSCARKLRIKRLEKTTFSYPKDDGTDISPKVSSEVSNNETTKAGK